MSTEKKINPFHGEAEQQVLKNQSRYKLIAKRYLKSYSRNKEIIVTADDIFQYTFLSFYNSEGKPHRTWNPGVPAAPQFCLAMKSVAFHLAGREKLRASKNAVLHGRKLTRRSNVQYEPSVNNINFYDISLELKKYYEWIIENNKVELFFILNEMLARQSDEEIARKLNIPYNRVKHQKQEIRKALNSLKKK